MKNDTSQILNADIQQPALHPSIQNLLAKIPVASFPSSDLPSAGTADIQTDTNVVNNDLDVDSSENSEDFSSNESFEDRDDSDGSFSDGSFTKKSSNQKKYMDKDEKKVINYFLLN